MKYHITGKNIEVTPALDRAIRDKLDKLDQCFAPDTQVRVSLEVNKDRHKIEITIPVQDGIIRSEQSSNDMYISLDLAAAVIQRQLQKYKGKLADRHLTSPGAFRQEFLDRSFLPQEEIRINRHKQFNMKPMYPEDACVQMELLGHSFYLFCNAQTEQMNVVYKRKDGSYGLIEPSIG
jgi:putative sigma-54 modulation protein